MGQKVVNVQSAVDLKRQKERQTYLVVVRTKMCDIASLEGHGHRRVDERGRDEEVDDPVCPPPPTSMNSLLLNAQI